MLGSSFPCKNGKSSKLWGRGRVISEILLVVGYEYFSGTTLCIDGELCGKSRIVILLQIFQFCGV